MFETITIYFWDGGTCDTCIAMNGPYHQIPDPPHMGCLCRVTSADANAIVVGERRELFDSYELLEEIGRLPLGGSESFPQTWQTGTVITRSVTSSATADGIGVTLGESEAVSSGRTGGRITTFNYDEEKGGNNQIIVAVYNIKIWRIIKTWLPHYEDLPEDTMGDFKFETYEHEEEREFIEYDQVGV